jgi:transaldolase
MTGCWCVLAAKSCPSSWAPVSTEVDARLSADTIATRERSSGWHCAEGIHHRPGVDQGGFATWKAFRRLGLLEQCIHTNLTLFFFARPHAWSGQAADFPSAGFRDWYSRPGAPDRKTQMPALIWREVSAEIYNYYATRTPPKPCGASFRNVGQITALAGW